MPRCVTVGLAVYLRGENGVGVGDRRCGGSKSIDIMSHSLALHLPSASRSMRWSARLFPPIAAFARGKTQPENTARTSRIFEAEAPRPRYLQMPRGSTGHSTGPTTVARPMPRGGRSCQHSARAACLRSAAPGGRDDAPAITLSAWVDLGRIAAGSAGRSGRSRTGADVPAGAAAPARRRLYRSG